MTDTNELHTFGTDDAVAFLNGTAPDAIGRTVHDYMQFSTEKWEECHNHIQWAFPSHIPSNFNPNAPVVDMRKLCEGLTDTGLSNLMELVARYLGTIGFVFNGDKWVIDPQSDRLTVWLTPRNHNFQRITRLLNLLFWVDKEEANDVLKEVFQITEGKHYSIKYEGDIVSITVVNADTLRYWFKAANGLL